MTTIRAKPAATAIVFLLLLGGVFLLPAPTARAEPGVTKDMTFLLHSVNASEVAKPLPGGGSTLTHFDTTLEFNDVSPSVLVQGTQKILQWFLSPALAGSFRIDGFTLRIWANSSTAASSNAQITLEIHEVTASGRTLVHQLGLGGQVFAVTPELKTWSASFGGTHTFPAESSIEVLVNVNTGAGQGVWFHYDTAQFNSRVSFRGPDSLAIAEIATLDAARNPTTTFDPAAANATMYVQARMTDPLGTYDVKWVNGTIIDPFGTILVDNATMTRVSGNPVDFESLWEMSWNYSGQPTGVYRIGIWAVDNNGHNWYLFFGQFTYADYDTYREGTFSIGEQFYVNALVRDDALTPLAGSLVEATQLGRRIAAGVTDATGLVNLTLGSGNYVFVAWWQDVVVASLAVAIVTNVSAADPIVIDAAVYTPTLRVVDSRGASLQGAAVSYTHPNGTTSLLPLLTNAAGDVALVRTAGGDYEVSVRWRGIEVANVIWTIASSETLVLPVRVYYADFLVIDSRSVGIAFASVVVREDTNGLVLDFQTTNETGWATSRLPATLIDVAVYTRDILVADVQDLPLTGDAVFTIAANMFYVDVTMTDPHALPLEFATVTVRTSGGAVLESVTADAQGQATLRLPGGTYALSATWKGVEVYADAAFDVSADAADTFIGSVFHLAIRTVDSQGAPVGGATVLVRLAGAVIDSATTDDAGASAMRLPGATYALAVSWKGYAVHADPAFAVSADAPVTLPLAVYYHTATLADSRARGVENATVRVVDATGETLAAGTTDGDGNVVVRLPAGVFTLEATWRNVLVASLPLSVAGDGAATYDAQVFYLTVIVEDRDGRPLLSVIVVVQPEGNETATLLSFTDAAGRAEFRLPQGEYAITARLIATYLLSPVDLTVRSQASLTAEDAEITLRMAAYEPALWSTNAFALAMLFVAVVGGLIGFVYWRYHRPQRPKGASEEERAAETEETSPPKR